MRSIYTLNSALCLATGRGGPWGLQPEEHRARTNHGAPLHHTGDNGRGHTSVGSLLQNKSLYKQRVVGCAVWHCVGTSWDKLEAQWRRCAGAMKASANLRRTPFATPAPPPLQAKIVAAPSFGGMPLLLGVLVRATELAHIHIRR